MILLTKEANRAASIARGADPGHQECDDRITIPMTTKKVETRA
jgi:hypothetical protein